METQRSSLRGGPGDALVPHRHLRSRSKIHHQSYSPHPKSKSLASNLHPSHPKAKNPGRDEEKQRDSRPTAAEVCRQISPTRTTNPLQSPPRDPLNHCLESSSKAQIQFPTSCASPPPSVGAPLPVAAAANPPPSAGAPSPVAGAAKSSCPGGKVPSVLSGTAPTSSVGSDLTTAPHSHPSSSAQAIPNSSVSCPTATYHSWADVVRGCPQHGVRIPNLVEKNCKDTSSGRTADSERSTIFKRWARGRCFRCLAYDHQVRSCKAPFRCIRCFGPGHREIHCCFQASSSSSCVLPYKNQLPPLFASRDLPTQTNQFAAKHRYSPLMDVEASSQEHQSEVPLSSSSTQSHQQTRPVQSFQQTEGWADKHHSPLSKNIGGGAPPAESLDSKYVATSLLEALRPELERLLEIHLEKMMRPFREELSTIKLWLARVATHVVCCGKQTEQGFDKSAANIAELFGPFSPVRLSPSSVILDSLAAHTSVDPLGCEATMVGVAESSIETPQELPLEQNIEVSTMTSTAQGDPQKKQMLIQADSRVEGIALVEEAPNDESHVSSSAIKVATTRCGRSSYGKSLLRRKRCLAQPNILKDLGFVKKNGKLDKDKLEAAGDLLKDLLPPDVLLSLMRLKGRAFWKAVAKIFDMIC